MKKTFVIALMALLLIGSAGLLTAQTICDNQVGTQGSYTYEYWKDQGSGCMVLKSEGAFSCDWSNINNLLARKGLRPGSSSNVVNYAATYNPNGNSYLCVYGWTTNPMVEYYIVDSWGTWRPPGGEGYMGTVNSDGATYDIYRTQRVNQPCITGNSCTFYQFWSVRQSKRTSGSITVGNHFNAWASHGMNMGSLYEVSFCVEGYQSSGTADVYQMSISSGPVVTDPPVNTPVPTATPTIDPNANLIVRASSTVAGANLDVRVNGTTVDSFTLDTSMQDYSTQANGQISLYYTNDDEVDGGMDVQVDYIVYDGVTFQAEDQATNTAVWQNDSCGGSNSEMMHCNGYILFDGTGTNETDPPTATPTPTPTPTGPIGSAQLKIDPSSKTVSPNSAFTLSVLLSSSTSTIAAYGIDVTYNSAYLSADTNADADAVAAGAQGYVAAANPDTPGVISITGFDVTGSGPGTNMDFLTIYLRSGSTLGSSNVGITINNLTEPSTNAVSGSTTGGTVIVDTGSTTCPVMGDGNSDGEVDIVDALLAAQAYVGMLSNASECLDVNCDGTIDIVDALLIAQCYVGVGCNFC